MIRRHYKPWGYFRILFKNKKCLLKQIVVKPDQQLSFQSHALRNEHWLILKGHASIRIGDDKKNRQYNDYIYIPCGVKHRIKNIGHKNLVLLELQTGEDFLEDDIIRYEDDYNRI